MAEMRLRRSDGFLLTDRIYGWSGWSESPAPRRDTISGMPTLLVGQKTRPRMTTITATFSADDASSPIANLAEIRRLHHRNQLLSFTDREGAVTDVRVLEWADNEPWEEVRIKTIVNISFLLLDPTIRY